MISVIISDCHDGIYLIRCINSIKRQTYKDLEIIAVWEENAEIKEIDGVTSIRRLFDVKDTLDLICRTAHGDSILFTSYYTVMSPNSLEDLCDQNRDEQIIVTVNEVNTETNREDYDCVELHALSGKILNKHQLLDAIQVKGKSYCIDYEIWNRYKAHYKEVVKSETAYSYYSVCDEVESSRIDYNKEKFINTLKEMETLDDTSISSLERYLVNRINYEKDLEDVCNVVCEYAGDSYYLMMNIVVKHYKSLYEDSCRYLKRNEYERIKTFLVGLDTEEILQELALKQLNISCEMFSAMRRLDYKNYRYVVQDNTLFGVTIHPEGVNNLSGPELANFVISRYAAGRLGAGTIVKSVGAWIKNKLGRN